MATISTLVERSNSADGVTFFTASFDCIIGIEVFYGHFSNYNGTPNILRSQKYETSTVITIGSCAPGTKISSIIMKAGESLVTNGARIGVYITGVSA